MRVQHMNTVQNAIGVGGQRCSRKDKRALAAHYGVGVRTIENWYYARIIVGQINGRKLEFDVADCSRRLLSHAN